jgi:cytochrome c-type biogenesis protein
VSEYLEAFLLGNAAILGNVCVLPLYPGLIAFLGGTAQGDTGSRLRPFLGLAVLAGVLSVMLLLGWLLFRLQLAFSAIFEWFLPGIFGIVLLLGLLMVLGRNPFARIQTIQAPVARHPAGTAYLYGAFLGPMTLPCTGPLVLSVFILGAGSANRLIDGIAYFVAFGIGFGWPLVVLPFLAVPFQRRFTGLLSMHHMTITRVSGLLLILVAAFGFWVDVRPNLGLV